MFCGRRILSSWPRSGEHPYKCPPLGLRNLYLGRELYDLQLSSQACSFCSTINRDYSPSHVSCGASTTATPCAAKFCNRLCRLQAEKVHPLLCPARNPASVPLLAFARKAQWMALYALTQCTSRLLLASQKDDATFDSDWEVVQGLAVLGMEERSQCLR
jgi:hypothetical protein